jgi:hypothetical protein
MDFYKMRKVGSIGKEDTKFSLVGRIKKVENNRFILEDETGEISIISNFKVKAGELVRVFCRKIDDEIIADFIQSMEGLDWELWKKVESLYLKLL